MDMHNRLYESIMHSFFKDFLKKGLRCAIVEKKNVSLHQNKRRPYSNY